MATTPNDRPELDTRMETTAVQTIAATAHDIALGSSWS